MTFDSPDESIPVLIFRLIVSPIAIFGNGVIIYIAIRFKKFRTSLCNCLIGLLALGELFVGIGIMIRAFYTFYVATDHNQECDRFSCLVIAIPEIFGIIFGQIIMLSMAIDRFLAVRKPIEYYNSKSKVRINITLAIALTLALLFCWYSLIGLDNTPALQCSSGAAVTKSYAVIWALFGAIMAVLIFAVYSATVFLLFKRTRQIEDDHHITLSLQKQRKVFISISMILLSYGVFWCIPLFIGIFKSTSMDPILLGYISLVIGLCSGINSCVGIFIYLKFHHELKEYFVKILPTFFRSDPSKTPKGVCILGSSMARQQAHQVK